MSHDDIVSERYRHYYKNPTHDYQTEQMLRVDKTFNLFSRYLLIFFLSVFESPILSSIK